jgi:hypothetical protein
MLKKIAAGAFLAGALALSAAAPAVLSAGTTGDIAGITAVGNWPDPMQAPQAVGNWPDPMSNAPSNNPNVGNWPDPM